MHSRPLQWHGQPYAEALYITFYQRSPGNSRDAVPGDNLCLCASCMQRSIGCDMGKI